MCSPKFKPGPPTEEAQVLSDRLNQALLMSVFADHPRFVYLTLFSSKFLSLKTLCIEKGKSVWSLYVDATCINYDGNAFDATLLAMVAALKNSTYQPRCPDYETLTIHAATLPHATYNPDTNQTLCSRRSPRVPLQLSSSTPISMSFGIFDS